MDIEVEVGDTSSSFGAVPGEWLTWVWGEVCEVVEPYQETEPIDLDRILYFLLSGQYQLWVGRATDKAVELVVFTQVLEEDHRKTLVIEWTGGQNIQHHLPEAMKKFEMFAIDLKCHEIHTLARKAFVRLMAKEGYKEEKVLLVKPVFKRWSN